MRRALGLVVVSVVALLTALLLPQFMSSAGAQGADTIEDGAIVKITNVQYGTFLGVDANDAVTTPVDDLGVQWLLSGPNADGSYVLQNVLNSRFLDGDSGGIDTFTAAGRDDRFWLIQEINPGQFHLRNVRFDQIIDADGPINPVKYDPAP